MDEHTHHTGAAVGTAGAFRFGGRAGAATGRYLDLRTNSTKMTSGTWAVIAEFDGPWHAWEIAPGALRERDQDVVIPVTSPGRGAPVAHEDGVAWHSSLDRTAYMSAVDTIRAAIDRGELEQMNLCRVLSMECPEAVPAAMVHEAVHRAHPAPYSGWFDIPRGPTPGAWLVMASPELAFEVIDGRLTAGPIKGTAPTAGQLLEKDYAENRLVTRALRASLNGIAQGARVTADCVVEDHPGMVQLVSRVEADVPGLPHDPGAWEPLLTALLPPLSVSGVPAAAAANLISAVEPVRRGPYCGAAGWLDVDAGECRFGVVIRSLWWEEGSLHYGTGAGITAASDPAGEWAETELKAAGVLLALTRAGLS